MRLSQLLLPPLGTPDSPDVLASAGYTLPLAGGLHSLLPLGQRVLRRIEDIFRGEMDRIGALEVTMPLLQPEQLWVNRAAEFGPQLFRLRDSRGDPLVLAPTHEEVAAILGQACIRSASDLPRVLFQIQPRFRDQAWSPAGGLLRTRQFVMADAYSFHVDAADLSQRYLVVRDAFCAAAARCGIDAELVRADAGPMGGDESEELVAALPGCPDTVALRCLECGYAASVDVAEAAPPPSLDETTAPIEEVALLDAESASEASFRSGIDPAKQLTAAPYLTGAGARVVLAVLPGDLVLNSVKLKNALTRAGVDTTDLHRASADELTRLGADYSWISLVRTPTSVTIVADESVRRRANFCFPSPRLGRFLLNVNCGRDFRVDLFADLAFPSEDAACPRCSSTLEPIRGIEIGHFFRLGSRYSVELGLTVASVEHGSRPVEMGSYGLGVTRLMAAIASQSRDGRGIVWPPEIAPFHSIVLSCAPTCRDRAEELWRRLARSGHEVLLDDSTDPLEEQLRRADLLGIPFQVLTPSPDAGAVEIRSRRSSVGRPVSSDSELDSFFHRAAAELSTT